ncbi:MAG: transketolase [Acidobacteria bacterium]|nr:transketolase [Acidobacteriota bacterium]
MTERGLDAAEIARLRGWSKRIRMRSLRMVHAAGVGHPGGDLSSADILATLYGSVLRVDPRNPRDPGRDRFIMSKGHSSASLYAALAEAGFFPVSELDTFARPLSALSGHPSCTHVPGVESSTGALGHGFPVAVGAALAGKIDGASWRVYLLTGDGELQEGSNWEAAMAASHYGLDNLFLIVDRNRFQQGDATEKTVALEPLKGKFEAFGWRVREVDGHDHAALYEALSAVPFEPGHPGCVIAHTRKGRGVSFMENSARWHHRVPTVEELDAALKEIDGMA